MKHDISITEVKTDVLIVGGGIAGGLAAISARESAVDVALVDKGSFGRSGCAAVASGVWHCFLPGDDFDLWYKEYVDAGLPLVDQNLLKKHILDTGKMVDKLEQWGVKWVKDNNGHFARTKATGDSVPRNAMLAEGGPQLMATVHRRTEKLGVKIHNKVMITDLLTSDGKHPTKGKVIGAIGFHLPTGQVYIFVAKNTILAPGGIKAMPYANTGSAHPRSGSIMPSNLTGDGFAMAFRAGAEMVNMDLALSNHGVHMRDFACAPSMNLLFGLGARFTNGLGERFMEKYDPVRKESTHRWVTGIAVAQELREGRGPITLDCTHFTQGDIKLCKAVIPIIMENFEKAGFDITSQKIVYEADYCGSISGNCGARTDDKWQSSLPGLYAAGASTDSVLPELPGCSIAGWYAGTNAADSSLTTLAPEITNEVKRQIQDFYAALKSSLETRDGTQFEQLQEKISKIMKEDIGIFHNGTGLKAASQRLTRLEKDLAQFQAKDSHDLAKVLGLKNVVQTLQIAAEAGIRRTESRKGFVRDDYPETDDINWLKQVVLHREGNSINLREVPITGELPIKKEKHIHIAFQRRSK